jgi:hypothetical protein
MVVLHQLVNNIAVPYSQTTYTLRTFFSTTFLPYSVTYNWQLHFAHLRILSLEGYETFTWPEVITAAKKVTATFVVTTLQLCRYITCFT